MRKLTLFVLCAVLILSCASITINAEDNTVIDVHSDRTTKIAMATQYTEFKDNSADANLYVSTDDIGDPYFDNVRAGDTFTYSINVKEAGKYNLNVDFGWVDATGKYTIKVDDNEVGVLDNTVKGNGWRVWTTSSSVLVDLPEGQHTLTIVNTTAGPNLKNILITPDGMEITDLGKNVQLYNGGAAQTPWNFMQNELSTISMQFNATAPVESLRIFAPNWNAPEGSEHTLELKLYKWDGSYEKTIAGEPVASKNFPKYKDGVWLVLPAGVEAGEYVLVVSNNDTPNSGFYIKNEGHESQRVYFNNEEKDNMAANLIITYSSTPEKDYGPLSPVEGSPENPPTNDAFVVSLIVVVAAIALTFLKKREVENV